MEATSYRSAKLPPSVKARFVNRYEEMREAYPSLSMTDFCKMNNLAVGSFASWRKEPRLNKRLRNDEASKKKEGTPEMKEEGITPTVEETWAFYSEKGPRCFLKESIPEDEARNTNYAITIEMNGHRIAFSEGFSSMELGEVMAIFEGMEKRRKILSESGDN